MKSIGTFSIIKYLPEMRLTEDGKIITNRVLDMDATRKAIRETGNNKIRIYQENEASGGYIHKIKWERGKFVNATYYLFSAYKGNKKLLHNEILAGTAMARVVNFKV
jgi:hypothetical protein